MNTFILPKNMVSKTLSREQIILVNHLRSNHINIKRVQMIESSVCPYEDPSQTINHLLFHCEKFNLNSSPIRNYIANKFPNSSPFLCPSFPFQLFRLLLAYMKANELFF